MRIRPWIEVEDFFRKRGLSDDEIFGYKGEYFNRVAAELGKDPEDEELEKQRKLFLYGNDKEWELFKAAKSGLIRGLGEVPETAADIIELGQKILPGESESATAIKENLRGEAERIREKAGPFQPSSFPEKLTSGLAAVPGTVASMVPITAPIAAAAPAEAGAAGAIAAGAAGFGLYEAIRNARGSWGDIGKGGLEGAALGGILGAGTALTRGVGKGVKNAVLADIKGRAAGAAAAGGGAGAFEALKGSPPEEVAQTAATFAVLSATHRNLYNKVAKTAEKAGITDPVAKGKLFETAIESRADEAVYLKNKRERKKRGETTPTGERTASQIAEESRVPFNILTGGLEWGKRILRTRQESKTQDKADLYKIFKSERIALNLEREKEKSAPGAVDENGDLTEGFRRYWDDKMGTHATAWVERIRKAPDRKEGAQYTVFDHTGERPLFTIERVDWSRKSPNQFIVKDLSDPQAEPRFFKSLTEAESSLAQRLEADPEMPISAVFNRGMAYANSDNRLMRAYGRSMIHFAAKKMGKVELAEATMPASKAETNRRILDILGIPGTQAPISGRGKFSAKHGNTTLADLGDTEGLFHEIGHEILRNTIRSKIPMNPNETEEAYGNRVREYFTKSGLERSGLFDPEELQILFGMGVKEYSPLGELLEINPNASSYEAEGIARYTRAKMYGLDPVEEFTPQFLNSPAGKTLQLKLERMYQGLDPVTGLEATPGFAGKMVEAQRIFDLWRQQDPAKLTEAMMSGARGGILTNPIKEIVKGISQNWFNHIKPIVDTQKVVWALNNKGIDLPDKKNLDFITQFTANSATGQMGRGGMNTGKIPTVTGEIKIPSFVKAVADSGIITKIAKKADQIRAINHYFMIHRLAKTQQQIEIYQDSIKAHTDPVFAEKMKLEGRPMMEWGEVLAVRPLIEGQDGLRVRYEGLLGELGRKYVEGKEPFNPTIELKRLNDANPNAVKLIEWEETFNAARALMAAPIEAGGKGMRIGKGAKERFFHDFDEVGSERGMAVLLEHFKRTRKANSIAEQVRENPLLRDITEAPDPLMPGSSVLKNFDFWGTGKKLDIATEFTFKLEQAHEETNRNRMMRQIYEMIGGQRKAGLNIGTIADPQAVEGLIKQGKLDPERDMLVPFRWNGEKIWIKFNPETPEGVRAYKSVKRINPLFMGNQFADIILGGPKRMMVLGTTGANVGFLIYTNTLKDSFTSAIQSSIKERRGLVGVGRTFKDFAPFLIRANLDIIRLGAEGALERAAKRGPGEVEKLKSYLRYTASPAKGSSMISADTGLRGRDAYASEIYSRAKLAATKNEDSVNRVFALRQLRSHIIAHPIDAARQFFAASEDLNRFPEFFLSEKQMLKEHGGYYAGPRPIKSAAEVSIDFKRAGLYSRLLNEMIPFFNPSMQGLNKFGRVLFNDKTPSLKNINGNAVALAGQTVSLPVLGLWALNKDEEWYKELPTWEKLMFMHAKLGDTVFRVPVPFEWGLMFGTLPVAVYDSIYNDAPERIKEQMNIALNQMLPYEISDFIPQLFKPGAEAAANKNFFTNIPIETKSMEGRLPFDRYSQGTLETYKVIGKFASLMHAPEFMQSPVMVEHLTRGYFGSVIHGIIADLEGAITLSPEKAKGGGILSRMISRTDRPGQSVQDFYTKLDAADKSWKTAKRLIESGDKTTAAKVLNKYKSKLGLTAEDIRRIILQGDTSTPPELLKMHQARLKMAELKKEEEDKAMTETAQAILGRDWD